MVVMNEWIEHIMNLGLEPMGVGLVLFTPIALTYYAHAIYKRACVLCLLLISLTRARNVILR